NKEAKKIAKQIVGSSLVKTAIHGEDPNWGRIISSIGQSEVVINPNTIDITLQSISVLKNSEPQIFSEEEMKERLQEDEIVIN
ncbi:bifunctional ornithine acetyltransferase/N-acetylglutamate synthase, partial [Klebsiella pneumoniae]|nr:bifunctional ornithine acetyltransferase/N-acetylglutamate synthase [Klebsiella pneumoniae]